MLSKKAARAALSASLSLGILPPPPTDLPAAQPPAPPPPPLALAPAPAPLVALRPKDALRPPTLRPLPADADLRVEVPTLLPPPLPTEEPPSLRPTVEPLLLPLLLLLLPPPRRTELDPVVLEAVMRRLVGAIMETPPDTTPGRSGAPELPARQLRSPAWLKVAIMPPFFVADTLVPAPAPPRPDLAPLPPPPSRAGVCLCWRRMSWAPPMVVTTPFCLSRRGECTHCEPVDSVWLAFSERTFGIASCPHCHRRFLCC